jgi:Flp pilus assembly protein TadG
MYLRARDLRITGELLHRGGPNASAPMQGRTKVRMKHARGQRNGRGTSTVEFLMVLPFLLLLALAGEELSRALMTMNVVTQAAREGARVGAVTPPGAFPGAAVARVNAVLAGANLTPAAVSVNCSAPCATDSVVTATVTVNFRTLFPVLLPVLGEPLPLTSTARMRFE